MTTHQLLFFLSDTSLCLLGDDLFAAFRSFEDDLNFLIKKPVYSTLFQNNTIKKVGLVFHNAEDFCY